jgi:type I restriction enzyme M protein
VDTFEEEQPVDLKAVSQKLVELEKEIDTTTSVIAGYCKVLGIKTPF